MKSSSTSSATSSSTSFVFSVASMQNHSFFEATLTPLDMLDSIPDDIFRHCLLVYLTLRDISRLDQAMTTHKYRQCIIDKLSRSICIGDVQTVLSSNAFDWLKRRHICLVRMNIHPAMKLKHYRRAIQSNLLVHLEVLRLKDSTINDAEVGLIWSLNPCPLLRTLELIECLSLTDWSIIRIIQANPSIQSLSIDDGWCISDSSVTAIAATLGKSLTTLSLSNCRKTYTITDTSMIELAKSCHQLQSLSLAYLSSLSDASVIALAYHCTGLQVLDLSGNRTISDAAIVAVSQHCSAIHTLALGLCRNISDTSITAISQRCLGLRSLNVTGNSRVTNVCIIAMSELSHNLRSLNVTHCSLITSKAVGLLKNTLPTCHVKY